MASETHGETNETRGTKQEAHTKVLTFPDYLRAVFRKSKAGFDRVHEELLKLYSSEKKSQNQKTFHRHDTRGSLTRPYKQAVDNEHQSNSQKGGRWSLRRQWAQSARAKTHWVPGVSHVQRSGSFVSYINEDYGQVPNATPGKTAVKRTLSLGEQEDAKETVVDTKCRSARKAEGDEYVQFSFDRTHITNLSDSNGALLNKQNEKETEPCHDYMNVNSLSRRDSNGAILNRPNEKETETCNDYINIKSLSLNLQVDCRSPRDQSLEENNHVPKPSLKTPFAWRQGNKNNPQYQDIDKEIAQTDSRNYRRMSKETAVCDSNSAATEGDYLSMDEVGNIKSSVNKASTAIESLHDTIEKTESVDDLGDSGDYVVGDFCQTESKSYRTSLGSTVCNSNDACTEDDYLSMDGVGTIKANVCNANIEKERLVDRKEKTELADDLGDSGDYVMGDFRKDQTKDKDPLYSDLEENPIDDQYASIDIKPSSKRNSEEMDDYVNVDPETVSRACLNSKRENDLLPRDIESVYDVPLPFRNPAKPKSRSVEKPDKPDSGSVVVNEEFYGYSVPEVVECLKACALRHLASVCEEERLDGYFFKNFDESLLSKEPFLLNWFHIAKLRLVISGWRPKK